MGGAGRRRRTTSSHNNDRIVSLNNIDPVHDQTNQIKKFKFTRIGCHYNLLIDSSNRTSKFYRSKTTSTPSTTTSTPTLKPTNSITLVRFNHGMPHAITSLFGCLLIILTLLYPPSPLPGGLSTQNILASASILGSHYSEWDSSSATRNDSAEERKLKNAEAERLRREYPENERLISSISSRFYEVVYPVQIRHGKPVGIATRDPFSTNRTSQVEQHYTDTKLLIKAFKYKFRLDLTLNSYLLAPNMFQKHVLSKAVLHITTQAIENCYYHGRLKDQIGMGVFTTCQGISGVIHIQNETYVIHPFYGGDLSTRHPHVIYRYSASDSHPHSSTCGNSHSRHEWSLKHFRKQLLQPQAQTQLSPVPFDSNGGNNTKSEEKHLNKNYRERRDVRSVPKYIELAIVLDESIFSSRPRRNALGDALQIINIVDAYFRPLNTNVSIVYLETWAHGNQANVTSDVNETMINFLEYAAKKMYRARKDASHLIVGTPFKNGEFGMSVPDSICTQSAVGVSHDANIFEPHQTAAAVAHSLGHHLGMAHDEDTSTGNSNDVNGQCECDDFWGCIMFGGNVPQTTMSPFEDIHPAPRSSSPAYHFSTCSSDVYINLLHSGNGVCLFNKPNRLEDFRACGNGKIDNDEECDCGSIQECKQRDPCCDPITCRLRVGAQCSSGPCCHDCLLKPRGAVCRPASGECDLPEVCTGQSGLCGENVWRKNGHSCLNGSGFCWNGECPTPDAQCKTIWGDSAKASEAICYSQYNAKGDVRGNCGLDNRNGGHLKCSEENLMCGSLQCQGGAQAPLLEGKSRPEAQEYSRTITYTAGVEYECKVLDHGTILTDVVNMGLMKDGTKCSEKSLCVNQTCLPVFQVLEEDNCPVDKMGVVCSGHGECSNQDTCVCGRGFTGDDCSEILSAVELAAIDAGDIPSSELETEKPEPIPVPPKTSSLPSLVSPSGLNLTTTIKEYDSDKKSWSAAQLALVLVLMVGGVFVFFALMAICYRRSMAPKDHSFLKKQQQLLAAARNSQVYGPGSFDLGDLPSPMTNGDNGGEGRPSISFGPDGQLHTNSQARIITFGSMPSYRDEKLIQSLKHQAHAQAVGVKTPPAQQHQASQTPTNNNNNVQRNLYAKENRKDSATSPVDPALMAEDDEVLLMDNGTNRFIDLPTAHNGMGQKISVKDRLFAALAAGQQQPPPSQQQQSSQQQQQQQQAHWASLLSHSQLPHGLDLAALGALGSGIPGLGSSSQPLLQDDSGLRHSRHSLHRQSSQGTVSSGASESPLTEVERTLKSLNGYHEDILEALTTVSAQRAHLAHQKSLECIRSAGNSTGGSGDGSAGPASLGRVTPNIELSKKTPTTMPTPLNGFANTVDSEYSAMLKLKDHYGSSMIDSLGLGSSLPLSSTTSALKIRNLTHLLKQVEDGVLMKNMNESDFIKASGVSSAGAERRPLALDSVHSIEQDLSYLLGDQADELISGHTSNSQFHKQSSQPPSHSIQQPQPVRFSQTQFGPQRIVRTGPMMGVFESYHPIQVSRPPGAYLTQMPPASPTTTVSTETSTVHGNGGNRIQRLRKIPQGQDDDDIVAEGGDEREDYDENGSTFDSDMNADLGSVLGGNDSGSQQSSYNSHLIRSASEEALSASGQRFKTSAITLPLRLADQLMPHHQRQRVQPPQQEMQLPFQQIMDNLLLDYPTTLNYCTLPKFTNNPIRQLIKEQQIKLCQETMEHELALRRQQENLRIIQQPQTNHQQP